MTEATELLESSIERDLLGAVRGVMVAYHASLSRNGRPSLPHLQRGAIKAFGLILGALEGADQSPCLCGACTDESARVSRVANRRLLLETYREGARAGRVGFVMPAGTVKH